MYIPKKTSKKVADSVCASKPNKTIYHRVIKKSSSTEADELLKNIELAATYSPARKGAVPLALGSLTTLFGMGRGRTSPE
jgi:hypothetical protein